MHTLTLLAALSAIAPTALAACNTFTPISSDSDVHVNSTDFNTTTQNTRVSDIIDCGVGRGSTGSGNCNSTACSLTTSPYQLIRIDRQLNLSVSEDIADEIFDLVRSNMPGDVVTEASWVYTTGGGGFSTCFEQGGSGWIDFTPLYSCVRGFLSECSDNGVEDETVIYACGVPVQATTINDTTPRVFGYLELQRGASGLTGGPAANATLDGEQAERQNGTQNGEGNGALGLNGVASGSALVAVVFSGLVGLVSGL